MNGVVIHITSDVDIVQARQEGRTAAEVIGFGGSDLAVIATAISEVARNIVQYANKRGKITIRRVESGSTIGIEVVAQDEGPGIRDLDLAMQDGYTTGSGLGLGLPGCRRLMDEFAIESGNPGTRVTMRKWLGRR